MSTPLELKAAVLKVAEWHESIAEHSGDSWHDDAAVDLREAADALIVSPPADLREKVTAILAPALDARAPYAKVMIGMIVDLVSGVSPSGGWQPPNLLRVSAMLPWCRCGNSFREHFQPLNILGQPMTCREYIPAPASDPREGERGSS